MLCLRLSLLVAFVDPLLAWGPLYEPLKGNFGRVATQLKARSDDEEVDSYPATLERTYTLHYKEEGDLYDGEILRQRVFISEPCGMDESLFSALYGSDSDSSSCGEDCEECPIPEEFRLPTGTIDVMAFLGIQRAEPIKVERLREWE